jgi:hypothetical protein
MGDLAAFLKQQALDADVVIVSLQIEVAALRAFARRRAG